MYGAQQRALNKIHAKKAAHYHGGNDGHGAGAQGQSAVLPPIEKLGGMNIHWNQKHK